MTEEKVSFSALQEHLEILGKLKRGCTSRYGRWEDYSTEAVDEWIQNHADLLAGLLKQAKDTDWPMWFYQELGYRITEDGADNEALMKAMMKLFSVGVGEEKNTRIISRW